MARLVDLVRAPVNESERTVVSLLLDQLPDRWTVVPNASLSDPRTGHAHECDAIVVAGHPICKSTGRRLVERAQSYCRRCRGTERRGQGADGKV